MGTLVGWLVPPQALNLANEADEMRRVLCRGAENHPERLSDPYRPAHLRSDGDNRHICLGK